MASCFHSLQSSRSCKTYTLGILNASLQAFALQKVCLSARQHGLESLAFGSEDAAVVAQEAESETTSSNRLLQAQPETNGTQKMQVSKL
eukprot:3210891-Amphidinium_carterae.1